MTDRVVVEGGLVEDLAAEDAQDDEAPSGHERENVRFWTAVLDNYAFADVTVEVPEVTKAPQLYVKVRRAGWGDWGLSFVRLPRPQLLCCRLLSDLSQGDPARCRSLR